jgi:hypothetical protein
MNIAEQILKHKPADTSAGVDDGQDKQGFEHDREVIPEGQNRPSSAARSKDVRHSERQ